MGSSGEGNILQRKLSRLGSRKSQKEPSKARVPSPKPPELSNKPSKLPPKPPELPPKPPKLPPKPPQLPPKPSKFESKAAEFPQHQNNLKTIPPDLALNPPDLTNDSLEITPVPSEPTPDPPEPIPVPPELTPDSPELVSKPSSRVFNCSEHGAAILQGFEHFRSDKALCDVTLVSGDSGETFPVHRVIMASASDYFRDMFTGGMNDQGVIKLEGVSGRGLRRVIEFIYTGGVTLAVDCLQETLEAATFLKVSPILRFCNDLLSSEITIDNCVEVELVAIDLGLEEVLVQVGEFVQRNFSALMRSGRYLQLSESCVCRALASDGLRGLTEAELYRAARGWLEHDPASRRGSSHALMSCVRFPLMSPTELLRISQGGGDDGGGALRDDPACVHLLLEASTYQMLPFLQPALQSPRTRIRSDSAHLLALGGVVRQQLLVSRELRLYDDGSGGGAAAAWRPLQPMEAPRYQHGAALIGGFLYVVGGQSEYDTKGKTAVDSVHRYDPRFDRWLQVASLNEKRTFFHLSALRGRLYAAGGRNSSGEIDSVECYDLSKNEWTFVSPMAEPRYGHAGTAHGELMYISGGITRDVFQKELLVYDPETDGWSRLPDMATPRGLHCMCTVGDRLYVMGGNHFCGANEYDDVLSCEFYSPATEQWTAVAPMGRGQSDVGVAVFRGQVYVVGGYSWSSRCMLDLVQRYDPELDRWEEVFKLLEPTGGIRACAMTVHLPEESVEGHTQEFPLSTP
ncbi:kelch-like protein 9 [Megalops cyprinoides]|uniref:kelch-like protein 9 n=1 Tax=Megalops cyprinoides TaxID=118141 RepID=UPI0018652141|nr:kelch-like protein 9 [Megalops cyprinoides]